MLIRRLNVNGRCPVCQCSLRLCQVTRLGVRPGPGQDIVPAGGITTQTANNGSDPDQILQLPRLHESFIIINNKIKITYLLTFCPQ